MKAKTGRLFHIGDILSITDGRLVSPRGIAGVYAILDYMCGADLMTHQLPRAAERCRPFILDRYPQLAHPVDVDAVLGEESIASWLTQQVAMFGEELLIYPLAEVTARINGKGL